MSFQLAIPWRVALPQSPLQASKQVARSCVFNALLRLRVQTYSARAGQMIGNKSENTEYEGARTVAILVLRPNQEI